LKTILCFDCSTIQASISLFVNNVLVDECISTAQRSHSEFITVALENLLTKVNKTASDIDLILLCNGPGSFTGIRVSVGLAKALSYSCDIPLWVVDSLTLLRSQVPSENACFASLNAYKNLVFGAFFDSGVKAGFPEVYSFDQVAKALEKKSAQQKISLVGDGYSLFEEHINPKLQSNLEVNPAWEPHPKSSWLFALHQSHPEVGKTLDWKFINPLYIRGSEAEENLKR
jgi:tRNA threonylcarbamoyl adenosine modification protein YeaZ